MATIFYIATAPFVEGSTERTLQASRVTWQSFIAYVGAKNRPITRIIDRALVSTKEDVIRITVPAPTAALILQYAGLLA